ncbi:MAG: hypothetical protein U0840_17750 [Gemmataceae bacterium]
MRHWVYIVVILGAGCSSGPAIPQKVPVTLDQVPANVMKVAQEKLPGVKFERAMKKANGEFEVIGKDPRGKVREIDIRPDGTVTEIE